MNLPGLKDTETDKTHEVQGDYKRFDNRMLLNYKNN